MNMFMITLCIALSGLAAGGVSYLCFYLQSRQISGRKNALQAQLDLQRRHHEMIELQQAQRQRYLREIQEQIDLLDRYAPPSPGEDLRLSQYRRELFQTRESLIIPAYCRNPMLNAVFLHKQRECEEHAISLQLQLSDFVCDFAKDIDMIGILYNLFDNAIEACALVEDPGKRWLTVTCRNLEQETRMDFANSKSPSFRLAQDKKTWKPDADKHGFGLSILRGLVKKYKGTLSLEEKPEQYRITLSFPFGTSRKS